jgi:phage tail-like protein
MAERNVGSGTFPDPTGERCFLVTLDNDWTTGMQIGAFTECTGLTVEYDVMDYPEGGQLGFTHKLRGGVKYPNLVLKRGVTHENNLISWFFDRTHDREHRGDVIITLLGDNGSTVVRKWAFHNAFPVKWTGPSFNAKSTGVATETLEIAHHGMVPAS